LVQFERLLTSVVSNPGQHISELGLLSSDERRQLLVEWNDTRVAFANDKCVHELFEEQVSRTPNAVAVTYEDTELPYSELNARVNQLAHRLKSAGVGPEVPVGVLLERSLETIVTLLAIFKAGGAYVPLDPTYPRERLRFMLEDAQPRVLLTQPALLSILPETEAEVLCVDERGQATLPDLFIPRTSQKRTSQEEGLAPAAGNLAYITYTSGSTGQPKGVQVLHRGVVRLVKENDYAHLGQDEVCLQFAPLAFDASTFEIWGVLLNGGRLVLMPPGATTLAV